MVKEATILFLALNLLQKLEYEERTLLKHMPENGKTTEQQK